MKFIYEIDPHDPSDDVDEPAPVVVNPDETEPVVLEEVSDAAIGVPPESWATTLADEDWAERLEGVDVSEDPEDGEPS
jgi:hypothetical protein